MKPNTRKVVLMRKDWQIVIASDMWSEILLFMTKRGWRPSVPTYYFFAEKLEVSQEDAISLAAMGQGVLDGALQNPLSIYPVLFDMGKLAEIVCFCEEGAFQLCR